jgi:peptide/nickel transport system permease protein
VGDTIVLDAAAPMTRRPRWTTFRRLLRERFFCIGLAIIGVVVLGAVFAPLLAPIGPDTMRLRMRFHAPSAEFLFGTDSFGRDIFARVLYGARLSMWIGLATAVVSGAIGTAIGVIAAQYRHLDAPLMRVMDGLMAFPAILLAIGVSAALGAQTSSVIVALTVSYIPRTARIIRGSALLIRELEFIEAAVTCGAGSLRIMLRHIVPNCMGPLLVQLSFTFAYAILAEAALSFIGVGPPPPAPTWGNIVAEGRDYAVTAWWIMFFPGLAISLAVLGMNILGDGLRDVLDPRLRIEG